MFWIDNLRQHSLYGIKIRRSLYGILLRIIKNRTSIIKEDYDVVIGKTLCGCAKMFKQIRSNQINIDKKALFKLLSQTPYDHQICLKTKLALSKLKLTNIHYYSSEDFA